MRVRRCAVTYIEPREHVEFDLGSLLAGGGGAVRRQEWIAHAPHLPGEVVLDIAEVECLGRLSPREWVEPGILGAASTALPKLLECGLVLAEDGAGGDEAKLRDSHWWPPAAMLHRASRWRGCDAAAATEAAGLATAEGLRSNLGSPPPAVVARASPDDRVPLPRAAGAGFDELLKRRATCRNFASRPLSAEVLGAMMQRVFSAQEIWQVEDDTVFLKKGSPSGGGLHPTEAYLIVQNVEGLAPGLYHYHAIEHALEPMPAPEDSLEELALRTVAGQYWFANAPVMVAMATRFGRCFWKYRRHPKAYRAVTMDVGHLSQTLYLAATDLGLGAFVTCAINEADIEEALGLDPLEEGVMALGGFGWRGDLMNNAEFDPAGHVWRT